MLRWVSISAWTLAAALTVPAAVGGGVESSPEDDRAQILRQLAQRFPGVPAEDYVYGALVASRDARAQYDIIMEFPPFLSDLQQGKDIWEQRFRNGRTLADCFPDAGRNVAGHYPYYDETLGKVVTFEMAINGCLRDNGEPQFEYGERSPMGLVTAYARTLSDGMRMNIRVDSPGAMARYQSGKQLFFRRIGQLNFACAHCHLTLAGRTLRTEILSPVVGQATHWPVFRGGDELTTLQARYKRCMEQMRAVPVPLGSEQMNDLEYFHSYLSNGLPMRASVFRK